MFVFDSKRTHSFAGPDGTRLSLELPGSWSSVAGAPVCLQDTVDGGSLQITPSPPQSSENFRHNMRKFIQPSVDNALLSSVEGSIEVHPFVGEAGVGYYFSAQDRNPKPSGWAFMTQVDFEGNGYVFHCTILSHRAPPDGNKEAMAALMNMHIIRAGT
jgi:hypothetical protein